VRATREELEGRWLRPPRFGEVGLRRQAAGWTATEAWEGLERSDAFEDTRLRRWFQVPADDGTGMRRNVRQDRWRWVARRPAQRVEVVWVVVAADAMVEAEEAGLAFARAWDEVLGKPPRERSVIWAFSGRGQAATARVVGPSVVGFDERFAGVEAPVERDRVGGFAWVARTIAWAEAWDGLRGTTEPDVDLFGPLHALYRTGMGLLAVNDDAVVLQHPPCPTASTRLPRSAERGDPLAVTRAVQRRSVPILRHLLDGGLDPNAGAPLVTIAMSARATWSKQTPTEHEDFVREATASLLEAGLDPGRDGARALYLRERRGDPGAAAMIAGGLPADVRDREGRTALHLAAQDGTPALLRALIEVGVPIDAADVLGWTPLHVAAHRDEPEPIDALLEAGADPLARTGTGAVPGDFTDHPGLPRSMPDHPRPARGAAVFDGESWPVFGDWLTERGDPRGEAIALGFAGKREASDQVLDACRPDWMQELARVHPRMEQALRDPGLQWSFQYGWVTSVRVLRSDPHDWTPVLAALVASPAGQRVQALELRDPTPAHWTSPQLRRLTILDPVAHPTLDLTRCPRLVQLVLRGRVEQVAVDAPGLRELFLERPFQRDAVLGPLLSSLHSPALEKVSATWHTAPGPASAAQLLAQARSSAALVDLTLRPAGRALLEVLVAERWSLQRLELASIWPRDVAWLLERADGLAAVPSLELRVLDLDRDERRVLQARWDAVRRGVVVRGASYRGDGGY
jgi:hypothetical protein